MRVTNTWYEQQIDTLEKDRKQIRVQTSLSKIHKKFWLSSSKNNKDGPIVYVLTENVTSY